MRILLSNDDGYNSDGLKTLRKKLSEIAEVWTVAPLREQSAQSHAFSLREKLRFKRRSNRIFILDGTPADCVYVGLNHLNVKFDAVVSGINHGPNLGKDIHYSGTVAAAREGCFRGIPALAVSMRLRKNGTPNFEAPALIATQILPAICKEPNPERVFYNLNVPDSDEVPTVKAAVLGRIKYATRVVEEQNGDDTLLSIGGRALALEGPANTDVQLYMQGFATLTPLSIDSTDTTQYKGLENRMFNYAK